LAAIAVARSHFCGGCHRFSASATFLQSQNWRSVAIMIYTFSATMIQGHLGDQITVPNHDLR
jgi:hypothetical protein